MTASRLRPALVVWILALLVIVVSGWVLLPFPRRPTGWEVIVWTIIFGVGFTSVGAVLVDRRPREPVSRLTLGIGLLVVAAVGLQALAVALDARPGDIPPVGALAAAIARALLPLGVAAAGGFLLVRFPNGAEDDRLTGVVNLLFALIVGCIAILMLTPGPIEFGGIADVANPLGVSLVDDTVARNVAILAFLAYAVSFGLSIVVVVRRYRRAGSVTRVQIRWVAAASLLPLILFPLAFLGPALLWSLWFLSTAAMPIAIGIAILRYRLYDIDRILSRTIGWALVTGLLVAVFAGTIVGLQALLSPVTDNNTLAVAASTLVAAALFQPLRVRVQRAVDRRFNRSRVDAQRAIDAFGAQLRDDVDLGALHGRLVHVVSEVVQPTDAGLWIRGAER